jgi:phage-related protein
MSYIEQFEQELAKKLTSSETGEQIVRWVSEKVLESFKNGITAGQKGAQVIRKGESRRGGSAVKAE